MKFLQFLILSTILFYISCRKDSFINSPAARVTISADTLKYDTVFVNAGSITQSFKIINENDQKLRLSSVKLLGGVNSPYKIIVDGSPGAEARDIEIAANDSIYVFAQVTINPNTVNLPFIVRDSIEITYNGVRRLVQLEAWGRNAHFFRDKQVLTNETWNNDLPYVILGYLYIDTNQVLTINKGCKIYFHADAPVIVDGTLIVNGTKDTVDRVYFQGDRLDEPYRNFPASWPGIYFLQTSKDNILNYAIIKNAYQAVGLVGQASGSNPKLTFNESVIDNAYDAGIISLNSSVRARNCLITNCGKNIQLAAGSYQFTHCTVATYSNALLLHRDPVLWVSDFANNTTLPIDAQFTNCIFWGENGTVDDEVVVIKTGNNPSHSVRFNQALWRVTNTPSAALITNPPPINNQAPQFDSIDNFNLYYDFRLKASSPAINKGTTAAAIPFDLDGKTRPLPAGSNPDLGCFEKQQ